MTGRTIKHPGPDHPITIERNNRRVIVTFGGQVISEAPDDAAAAIKDYLAFYPDRIDAIEQRDA